MSGDKYEHEAYRLAGRVMRMPGQPFSVAMVDTNPHQIQRAWVDSKEELQRQVDQLISACFRGLLRTIGESGVNDQRRYFPIRQHF